MTVDRKKPNRSKRPNQTTVGKLKGLAAKTPLHRPLLNIQGHFEYRSIMKTPIREDVRTGYCISPFKTGTTFVARVFGREIAQHEPLMFVTLKHIDNEQFLRRRKSFLDLRIESSGFLSLIAEDFVRLNTHEPIVFMIRDPSEWIGSMIDYAPVIQARTNYHYAEELFWQRVGGLVRPRFFHDSTPAEQAETVENLLRFWIRTYTVWLEHENCHILRLEEADESIGTLEEIFGQKATNADHANRRKNKERKPFSAWDHVTREEFAADVARFGY